MGRTARSTRKRHQRRQWRERPGEGGREPLRMGVQALAAWWRKGLRVGSGRGESGPRSSSGSSRYVWAGTRVACSARGCDVCERAWMGGGHKCMRACAPLPVSAGRWVHACVPACTGRLCAHATVLGLWACHCMVLRCHRMVLHGHRFCHDTATAWSYTATAWSCAATAFVMTRPLHGPTRPLHLS